MERYNKEIRLINELIQLAKVGEVIDINKPLRMFGSDIAITGDISVIKYDEIVDELYLSDKEVKETVHVKKHEETLINLIRKLKIEDKPCTSQEYGDAINKLLKIEIKDFEIIYELFGFVTNVPSINFGDFTVYSFQHITGHLDKVYPDNHRDIFLKNMPTSAILIGVKARARDEHKASEICDGLCESFENVFNYVIGDITHQHNVGIFNFRGWKRITRIITYKGGLTFSGENTDTSLPINITDPFFKSSKGGYDKIWYLITKENKSEIEGRILNSIEWVGKAINEKDFSKALVQFVFAVEGMLQFDAKSNLNPSVISQISDWIAFIISDKKEGRKKIAKHFKEIYRKRSAIAHGGKTTIEFKDIYLARDIARHMLHAFLTRTPFSEMKTMEELAGYIEDLKFQ